MPLHSHWSRTTRPYLAGFAAVALAASSDTRWLQTSVFGLLVFVWPRTSVPRRWHTSGPRKSSTGATLFHRQIVCRSTHTQHIRQQELRCGRATCLEQSSGPLAREGHYIRQTTVFLQINVTLANGCPYTQRAVLTSKLVIAICPWTLNCSFGGGSRVP